MLAKFQVTIVKNSSNAELNILFLYMPSEVFPPSVIKTFLALIVKNHNRTLLNLDSISLLWFPFRFVFES
nr:hypothetical protein CFP56_21418 [Quercus suber]